MKQESAGAPRSSFQHPRFVISLLLMAGGLALYAPVKKFGFLTIDDPQYLWLNVHVLGGLRARNAIWAFTSTDVFYWQPLTWLSHMSDVSLYGMHAVGHHFTNIFWHVINGVLVFLLLTYATGKLLRSVMVAAVFVVHPLNLEPVIWVAERKTLLCTFFFLLTLAAYGWYAKRASWQRYTAVLVSFMCALMAKPMAVTLPLVLLILDYWPLERFAAPQLPLDAGQAKHLWRLIGEKLPLVLLAALTSMVTYVGTKNESAVISQSSFPWHERVANALYSYWIYIGKIFWPQRLSVFYPMPNSIWNTWLVILAALGLAGVTFAFVVLRRERYLLASWLWFLIVLIPMIGLVQVGGQARADRHVYLPMIGVLVLVVWLIAESSRKLRVPATLCGITCVMVLIALFWDARIQMQYWRSSETLFTRSLEVTPEENYYAHMNLATALAEEGHIAEAMPHFEVVYRRFPDIPEFREWHANLLSLSGQFQAAIPEYRAALPLAQEQPLRARLHFELGSALEQINQLEEAESEFREAIHLDPEGSPRAYIKLGYLLAKKGSLDDAADQYERSVQLLPTAQGYYLLGDALLQKGRAHEAEIAYRQALGLNPGSKAIQQKLQQLEQSSGQP